MLIREGNKKEEVKKRGFVCVNKGTSRKLLIKITIPVNTTKFVASGGSTGGGAAARTRRRRNRPKGKKHSVEESGSPISKGSHHRRYRKKSHSSAESLSMVDSRSFEEAEKTAIERGFSSLVSAKMEVKISEPVQPVTDMKSWFTSLSAIERAAALGFSDGTVLAALFRLASSSEVHSVGVGPEPTTEGRYRTGQY